MPRTICIGDETKAKVGLKRNLQDYRKRPMLISEDLKLDHLIDTMYFGNSEESTFLQLADVSAYFIKRMLLGKTDAEPFYKIIERQVTPQPLNIQLLGYYNEATF